MIQLILDKKIYTKTTLKLYEIITMIKTTM